MCHVQGFASGDLERDATAVRLFTDAGLELLLSQVALLCNAVCLGLVLDITDLHMVSICHLCTHYKNSASKADLHADHQRQMRP